ncbi:MAG: 2-hydroxychromene-2-carboxylate isomerase [Deltaproteobacteria bacterium]|nr:MAG: 2-hydroxychromene-2-carboxylate isomerase [Deltaproteobacteria bacterium]
MAKIEYWYDIVCPYAYLASTQIARLERRTGRSVEWRPFLLGGVFRSLGVPDQPKMSPAKARMNLLDLHRWADWFGVSLRMPAAHPRRTVLALRAILAAGEARVAATQALFRAYWVIGQDVSDPEVVARILADAGLDGPALVERAGSPEIKEALRRETDTAVARGIFGAPAFVVDGALFWGQDRLDFVEAAALGGGRLGFGTPTAPEREGAAP